METIFQGDDRMAAVAIFIVRIFPGRLNGTFIGFGTGIREEHLLHPRLLAQFFGQDGLRFRVKDVRNVAQFMELRFDGLNPFVVTDAKDIDGNAGTEVDILFPLYVV